MAKRKKDSKKIARKKAIEKALSDGRETVIINERPCSVEIIKNSKGYTYAMKVYVEDIAEMKKSVKDLNSLDKSIRKTFAID